MLHDFVITMFDIMLCDTCYCVVDEALSQSSYLEIVLRIFRPKTNKCLIRASNLH